VRNLRGTQGSLRRRRKHMSPALAVVVSRSGLLTTAFILSGPAGLVLCNGAIWPGRGDCSPGRSRSCGSECGGVHNVGSHRLSGGEGGPMPWSADEAAFAVPARAGGIGRDPFIRLARAPYAVAPSPYSILIC